MIFKQVYMKMITKDDTKSTKVPVILRDLKAKPTATYVDFRPTLK
ncbi:hypothetical protein [Spiroplasma endosymbiont of Polydrusus formosus]